MQLKAYNEVVELFARGSNPGRVVAFRPSEESRARVEALLTRAKTCDLTPEEQTELDDFLQLEHMMRLVKARAQQYLSAKPS